MVKQVNDGIHGSSKGRFQPTTLERLGLAGEVQV